ncbi:MAG: phosphoribosylformylglycinamidine synthase subunit PurL [Balneola sp.]|nr:phosphoribosylformylglycinamidine synthase subunit PurL [Balneola sp.]MBO6649457.1 phosphoribosylformylglycinamidine synthase subunit PurL [Balneola sp.]MBO6711272.1 phosphoribosylformylglycinamidine synthase subunit PurL [Balneola sp.]MBO6800613.1 phosphoribosylformylglycinamidine synthase subunit PurL [Balneola sp.]MBO6869207.1 phosphoribosylformylglycinamidine synthase subunit PurL [Balneola sp.]
MADATVKEPEVNLELALEHGLNEEEFEMIKTRLGRVPTFTELGVYSVMWSEHCSYKNSIVELKKLPREGEHMLVGAGEENAGLVDIGDGLGCAFKIESHNHPSAIEPYQGAATGVGGIHRDIFTMGARPVASLNSLRFGSLENPRVRYLLDGVVRGIGDYGNSFGIPVIGGEVYFDESYEGNPLVNAMSIGLVEAGKTVSAISEGIGNPVIIVGASTGRDGIHGATFASEEISEESEAKRPSVQVGDPFTEKLLLEASLEVLKTGAVVGMQDMGAAGIACSTSEMTAKGGQGMLIDLDKVPAREEGMTAYELLLSESQERMLIVAEKGREQEVIDVYEKWDLHGVVIGEVVDTDKVTYMKDGEVKGDMFAEHLVLGGGAPQYIRETKKPEYLDEVQNFDISSLKHPSDHQETIKTLLSSVNVASKRWVHEQYDTTVRTNTVTAPGASDAGVIRVKGTNRGLVAKTDCNGRYVYLNPRRGGQIAVIESARNVVCSGGKPLAITNCLNFGNPYKPEVYWTFKEALGGMGDACKALNTPVTGGNVSFYNENPNSAIFPSPIIGMLGLIEDVENHTTTPGFKNDGDVVMYIGAPRKGLGGTEYLKKIHGLTTGDAPELDIPFEVKLQESLLDAIKKGWIKSAHDISDGGLAIALAEKAIFSKKGVKVSVKDLAGTDHEVLFSEAQSGVLITLKPDDLPTVISHFGQYEVPTHVLGTVTGDKKMVIEEVGSLDVEEMSEIYEGVLPGIMG